tara:strand:+ start:4237 stop:4695 length:459 start_codon:yes stop_codon:yes gene_type:complete
MAPITMNLVKTALTASGAATTVGSGTMYYAIKGKAYTLALMSGTATPTTDINTGSAFTALAVLTGSVFLFGLNAAGDLKVAQGTVQALDVNEKFVLAPQFPAMPADFCPIAYITVKVGSSGSAWTFGSSNWNATDVVLVIQDIVGLPERPQV